MNYLNASPLSLGQHSRAVAYLQYRLGTTMSGEFDVETESVLKRAQSASGNQPDGVYGPMTNAALTMLHAATVATVASALDVEKDVLRALLMVETVGRGFYTNGLPKILLERHYVHRLATPAQRLGLPADLCSETPGGYIGGLMEWSRFDRVAAADINLAIRSCSWGLGQLMGDHCDALGLSPVSFMLLHAENEDRQLETLGRFILTKRPLLAALRAKAWTDIARLYNGPDYAKNSYDAKLAAAYAKLAPTVSPA